MVIWIILNILISCIGVFVSMVIYRRYHKDVVVVSSKEDIVPEPAVSTVKVNGGKSVGTCVKTTWAP